MLFLKEKFQPKPRNILQVHRDIDALKLKAKNKQSRERYRIRCYKKKLQEYECCVDSKNVINLSSIDIQSRDLFALELGHGFVPTTNSVSKEEESLVLEGFRFIDRLGKADKRLSRNDRIDPLQDLDDTYPESSPTLESTPLESTNLFTKTEVIPPELRSFLPCEPDLCLPESKIIKKDFEKLNNNLLTSLKSKQRKKRFNLPKMARESLIRLKKLVHEKVIDIRKVDKGQVILIIDYAQRILAEAENISKIARLCPNQESNWKENKDYAEEKMIALYSKGFVSKRELTAVCGLIAGGMDGKKRKKDGSLKYTQVISQKELYAEQPTPYVYPLFKAHKVPKNVLLNTAPDLVAKEIPSRLVVGMKNCQLSRVQKWLESILNPISKIYGRFEYIKDSFDFLKKIENVKSVAVEECWDWENLILFTVDVKALYPSVQIDDVALSLKHCLAKCTEWGHNIISILVDLICYTLKNQQIRWNGCYYLLSQGIPTGGKHSVPIANILLSFILLSAIEKEPDFMQNIKLWVRFIDDGKGIFLGNIDEFELWFHKLEEAFEKFGLKLTCDTDSFSYINNVFVPKSDRGVTFLDMDVFLHQNTIHTKEHRKETAASSYLPVQSAHPKHTFSGIVKSQMYRLRRICSLNEDFEEALINLERRCLNSGYDEVMVRDIISFGRTLERKLEKDDVIEYLSPNTRVREIVKLVVLAGTGYENCFSDFATRVNSTPHANIKVVIVKTTGLTIGQLLFNNSNRDVEPYDCMVKGCVVCPNDIQNVSGVVVSNVSGSQYFVKNNLNCNQGGIYIASGICSAQYTGKTVYFGTRMKEHLKTSKGSSVYCHMKDCHMCNSANDFEVTYVENYHNRGKYSLSEREYLWNYRIKGTINLQKTLMKS